MDTALIVIDVQNDYFPGGAFPLWNTDAVLEANVAAIADARSRGEAVILVRHEAASPDARFLRAGTAGAEIHPRILTAAPDAPVVAKRFADSFHQTALADLLRDAGVRRVRIAGMMTQNCVVFTALSKAAEPYAITVLSDCTTTVNPILHALALNGLSTRVDIGAGVAA